MAIRNRSPYPFRRSTPGAIGFDLYANIGTPRDVAPGSRWRFDTGIGIALPDGIGALVQPRSGLALHHGVFAITGVIDLDYRGDISVLLVNASKEVYQVKPGDRIAQLVLVQIPNVHVLEAIDDMVPSDELGITERGAGGFGSTGR